MAIAPGAVADRQRAGAPASRRQRLTKRNAFSMGLMCCKPESHVHAVAPVIKCSSGGRAAVSATAIASKTVHHVVVVDGGAADAADCDPMSSLRKGGAP